MKVIFTKSPTGAFGLAYSKGDQAEINDELAKELISANFAQAVKAKAAPKSKKKSE
jgi:hypothetical protein